MTKIRRFRCPDCGSLDTKCNGKYKSHQHYFSKHCHSYFTDRRKHISTKNMFVWFERWIPDKQSIVQLASQSPYSERSLKHYFYKQLPTCPQWQIQRRERYVRRLFYSDARSMSHTKYRLGLRRPKSDAAREQLEIVRYLTYVETNEDAQIWMRAFIE